MILSRFGITAAEQSAIRSSIVLGPDAEYAFHTRLFMTLRQLKWITLIAPLFAVLALELAMPLVIGYVPLHKRLILDGLAVMAILAFHFIIFRFVDDMQGRLRRHNEELLALHSAGLDIAAELSLDAVLKKVVDLARNLADAKYGALSVISENRTIRSFITSGITPEQRARLGAPPVGHGLLGVVLNEGQTIRTTDLSHDSRSIGFPPEHPAMKSLLAVPIPCKGPFRGNLYLTEKRGKGTFTIDDEETLRRFAVQAAIAIDNAHLHERVADLAVAQERLHIAHEMHDGVAQVLAYVNTKVQAANEYLKRGNSEQASVQLRELASSARSAFIDVREAIVGLRSLPGPEREFAVVVAEYLEEWRAQSGVSTQLTIDESLALRPGVELQVIRILQEALTNVRKHAKATRATVVLRQQNSRIELLVEDDGVGFDPAVTPPRREFPRFGLTTMRERAESVGALLTVQSTPGKGTSVRFELPLPAGS